MKEEVAGARSLTTGMRRGYPSSRCVPPGLTMDRRITLGASDFDGTSISTLAPVQRSGSSLHFARRPKGGRT